MLEEVKKNMWKEHVMWILIKMKHRQATPVSVENF